MPHVEQNLTRRRLLAGAATAAFAAGAAPLEQAAPDQTSQVTPFLDEFDRAPAVDRAEKVRNWLASQPGPFFAELRAARPVLVTPEFALLARYADVIEALSLPAVFSVAPYRSKMGGFMLAQDEVDSHDRDKGVLQALLPHAEEAALRERVAHHAAAALRARAEGSTW